MDAECFVAQPGDNGLGESDWPQVEEYSGRWRDLNLGRGIVGDIEQTECTT
jgi:hypothetical protein